MLNFIFFALRQIFSGSKESKWLKFAICNLQKFENVVFIEWKMYAYWQQNLTLVYLECATKLANDEYFKEC